MGLKTELHMRNCTPANGVDLSRNVKCASRLDFVQLICCPHTRTRSRSKHDEVSATFQDVNIGLRSDNKP